MTEPGSEVFTVDALRAELTSAATQFSDGPGALAGILTGIVDDVDRALREELEIFPVCHHSPASALAMARRLREKQPAVIYMELCEDLRPLLTELRNCKLPVALQAYASELDGFPGDWGPLSVVAPITESSAEFQAIAYALDTPGVELVLVDRSCDHVFQWQPRSRPGASDDSGSSADDGDAAGGDAAGAGPRDEDALHGDAVGIEIGDLRPRFAELEAHLLHHGKVRHWSEWWDQYVEQPLANADYETYRQVMVLIGSLFRRLGSERGRDRHIDEDRERYMWTRMRQHLAATGADPATCLYICGAFHAASHVEQFGLGSEAPFEITSPTATSWRYGLIPSSHSAIEAQFGLAGGSVSIAAATWSKALRRGGVKPYRLMPPKKNRKLGAGPDPGEPALDTEVDSDAVEVAVETAVEAVVEAAAAPAAAAKTTRRKAALPAPAPAPVEMAATDRLSGFLSRPPMLDDLDETELLGWCVEIVHLARRNGYLASTADSIAIFETSILLAGMRNRSRPTPYDFQDAAVTCIEKESVPGRRDVQRLCEILLGGDRVGQVGYDALPPLARDVYDRLAPLDVKPERRTMQRALLDLDANPELRPCSDLLWMLRRLLPSDAVRPIMGDRRLGVASIQESWDLGISKHQRAIIELGYEGVTVEQVLEQRLRRTVREPNATAATALGAVEDSLLFLRNRRLTDDLGVRAVELLAAERSVDEAPEILRRIRRLLAYYRTSEPTLPAWCESFVTAGYAHYCTLLPTAFVEDETGLRQVSAMLGFLFGMESLALSLGCDRVQLELAVAQSHPEAPAKLALLWAAKQHLGRLTLAELRALCDDLLANPLVVASFPLYLSGLVQALEPVPSLAPFVVEVLSNAFGRLPDAVLLPWLPKLITTLRKEARELVPVLVREAGRTFPGVLPAVDAFVPPWAAPAPTAAAAVALGAVTPVSALLAAHPQTCDALAMLLGDEVIWQSTASGSGTGATGDLLDRFPAAALAASDLLG